MASKSRQRKSQAKRPQAGKTAPSTTPAHKPWQIAAVCILLALATAFAYHGVRNNDFLSLDDNNYVSENSHVQQGVTGQSVAWAFTTFQEGNWHPLTWISHMIDWSLYGMHPAGYHVANVCLHAANSILLFLLFLSITGFLGRSAMVSFLFALHPAHVESVAWIAERKDLLCAFFWFAALLGYAWFVRKPSWKRFIWVVLAFACALMSKPMAVTLPFTLLLLDYWPLRRMTFAPEAGAGRYSSLWKLCIEKWPLFIMAAASSVVTVRAQGSVGAVVRLQSLPVFDRISNAAISYSRYIRILFWPDPLTAFYYHEVNHIAVAAAILSIIGLLLVTVLCWKFRKDKPYCLVGWLWFLGTLVPAIGIVQVGNQAMAERYTYVPYIGLFIALVWLAGDAVIRFPNLKLAAQLLAVAVLVACAVRTDAQVAVWKDSITLLSHALEVDPRGEFPNSFLGIAYMRQGNYAEAQKYFDRALIYNSTWYLPLSSSAYCIMRSALQTHDQSNLPLAHQRLELALRDAPKDPFVLTDFALWSVLMGNPQDEEMYSRRAIAASPEFIGAWLYLGVALDTEGKLDQAIQVYQQALAIAPNNSDAHNYLGMVQLQKGDFDKAAEQFRDALTLNPADAGARKNLSLARARVKN
jgi:tetratricopeptide (TPR) repeat protein